MATHSEHRMVSEVYTYLDREPGRRATTQGVYNEMARVFSDADLASRVQNHQVRFAVMRLREIGLVLPEPLSDGSACELCGTMLNGDELLADLMGA